MAVQHEEEGVAETLREHLANNGKRLRPILTRLNIDNSWLLSCPRPLAERAATGKMFYHLVIDPWLAGTADFLASWVLRMRQPVAAKVPNTAAVEARAVQIEELASAAGHGERGAEGQSHPAIDAIMVSTYAADHCHEDTLKSFSPEVPVFAAPSAAAYISSWKHFHTVVELKTFDPDTESWRSAHAGSPLPDWLTMIDIVGHGPGSFAQAIIISSGSTTDGDSEVHEQILFTPHGILPTQRHFENLVQVPSPPVTTLAIMCPLKETWTLGAKVVLGVDTALALGRKSEAKYLIPTASEILQMTGLLNLVAQERRRTFDSALDGENDGDQGTDRARPNYIEVENGGCFVLE